MTEEWTRPEFVSPEFQNQMLSDFSEATYHADLTAVARGDVLARLKSPAHLVARRQAPPTEDNDILRLGRAVHEFVLEPAKFAQRFVLMPPFGDMRSSKNREVRDAWLATVPPDATVTTEEELAKIRGIGLSISKNSTARALLENSLCEQTCYFRDPETGLKTRVRPDLWNPGLGTLVDLKTTISAEPRDFQKSAWAYRYDLQLAMYAAGVTAATGSPVENVAIIAVEKVPPYGVQVFELDADMQQRGWLDYRRGMDGIAESLIKNEWPCYGDQAITLSLPKWA